MRRDLKINRTHLFSGLRFLEEFMLKAENKTMQAPCRVFTPKQVELRNNGCGTKRSFVDTPIDI